MRFRKECKPSIIAINGNDVVTRLHPKTGFGIVAHTRIGSVQLDSSFERQGRQRIMAIDWLTILIETHKSSLMGKFTNGTFEVTNFRE